MIVGVDIGGTFTDFVAVDPEGGGHVYHKVRSTPADPSVDGPAVVLEFRRTRYHKPADDLSRPVDWDAVARFTRVNVRIGASVAGADAPPAWHPGNFFGEKFGAARAATRWSKR